jgi:hypothetical protein
VKRLRCIIDLLEALLKEVRAIEKSERLKGAEPDRIEIDSIRKTTLAWCPENNEAIRGYLYMPCPLCTARMQVPPNMCQASCPSCGWHSFRADRLILFSPSLIWWEEAKAALDKHWQESAKHYLSPSCGHAHTWVCKHCVNPECPSQMGRYKCVRCGARSRRWEYMRIHLRTAHAHDLTCAHGIDYVILKTNRELAFEAWKKKRSECVHWTGDSVCSHLDCMLERCTFPGCPILETH